MKVLSIIGASKTGNTTEVLRYFKSKLASIKDYTFEDLYLEDYKIDFCNGCHNCIMFGEDKCPQYSVIKTIEDKILFSDILILASPGYMFSVTGIMKNFLDHVAYNCHRPKYFGKKIFIVSNSTKWQEASVSKPMETWASASGFEQIGKLAIDILPFPLSDKELDKRRSKIKLAASKFDKKAREMKIINPDFGGLMVFHAFRTLCAIAPNVLKADYNYFKEKKAYDKGAKWFVEAKISPVKHFIANLIERKMKKDILKMIDLKKLESANGIYRNKL